VEVSQQIALYTDHLEERGYPYSVQGQQIVFQGRQIISTDDVTTFIIMVGDSHYFHLVLPNFAEAGDTGKAYVVANRITREAKVLKVVIQDNHMMLASFEAYLAAPDDFKRWFDVAANNLILAALTFHDLMQK
jgi:hypothetical protein